MQKLPPFLPLRPAMRALPSAFVLPGAAKEGRIVELENERSAGNNACAAWQEVTTDWGGREEGRERREG